MATNTNNKSASASATTNAQQQKNLTNTQFFVTISEKLRKGQVQTNKGLFECTITNTKPTTHIRWTDGANKYDILVPTNITIDGEQVNSKYLTQKDFENFLIKYAKKSFLIDKSITPQTKSKKLDLRSIPEFSEKMKKIDDLQKQIDELMQSIKQSDTYKQLTQTEKQKQAQSNLIDKMKKLLASGAIKIDDLK